MDKSKALNKLDGAIADLMDVHAWLKGWNPYQGPAFDFPVYGQTWLPWRAGKLGFSDTLTIGSWGCVVCSAASIVSVVYRDRITPSDVNDRMKIVGGFDGANFYFSKLPAAYPKLKLDGFVKCDLDPAPVEQLDAHIASGGYAIIKVDLSLLKGGTQQHWLAVFAGNYVDGYEVMDPWIGCPTLVPPAYCDMGSSDPTAARWIFAIAYYSAK